MDRLIYNAYFYLYLYSYIEYELSINIICLNKIECTVLGVYNCTY